MMLDPNYFYDKTDTFLSYYQDLEDYMLRRIAEFMLKSDKIGGTADRNLLVLQQMGMSNPDIVKKLSQLTGKSQKSVRKLLTDSAITSFGNDKDVLDKLKRGMLPPAKNPAVVAVLNAEFQKTVGELDNLTRTTLGAMNSSVIHMLNEAEIRVASGAESYEQAICNVLDAYAVKGLMLEYPTGTRRSLESAVRCAIVTSMNQTAAQVTNQYIIEGGCEYVLISAHPGARHDLKNPNGLQSHDWWQGKAFKINGSEKGYPNLLESTGYNITEDGMGVVVNPLGLHGYNCRHSHQPWMKELDNPWIDETGNPIIDREESEKVYINQQKQRAMERSMRSDKRQLIVKQAEIDALGDNDVDLLRLQDDYDLISYRYRNKRAEYESFCEKNNLQTQWQRTKASGFTSEDAKQSRQRANIYEMAQNS